jgi:hypothetical protein
METALGYTPSERYKTNLLDMYYALQVNVFVRVVIKMT